MTFTQIYAHYLTLMTRDNRQKEIQWIISYFKDDEEIPVSIAEEVVGNSTDQDDAICPEAIQEDGEIVSDNASIDIPESIKAEVVTDNDDWSRPGDIAEKVETEPNATDQRDGSLSEATQEDGQVTYESESINIPESIKEQVTIDKEDGTPPEDIPKEVETKLTDTDQGDGSLPQVTQEDGRVASDGIDTDMVRRSTRKRAMPQLPPNPRKRAVSVKAPTENKIIAYTTNNSSILKTVTKLGADPVEKPNQFRVKFSSDSKQD